MRSLRCHSTGPCIAGMPIGVNIESILGYFGPCRAAFRQHFEELRRGCGVSRKPTSHRHNGDWSIGIFLHQGNRPLRIDERHVLWCFTDLSTAHGLNQRSSGVGNCLKYRNKPVSMIFQLAAMVVALALQYRRSLHGCELLLKHFL